MTAHIDDSILEGIYDYLVKGVAAGTATSGWKWLGLLDDTGTEVVGGSYARIDITPHLGSNSSGVQENSTSINFTSMPAITVRSWGLWTDSTGGTRMVGNTFVSDVVLTAGQTLTIDASALMMGIEFDTGCGMATNHRAAIARYVAGVGSLIGKAEVFSYFRPDTPLDGYSQGTSPQTQWGFHTGITPDFDDFDTGPNAGVNLSTIVNRVSEFDDGTEVAKCGLKDTGSAPTGGFMRIVVPLTNSDTPDPDENIYIFPGDMVISLEPQ